MPWPPATRAASATRTKRCRPASKYIANVIPKRNQIDDLKRLIALKEQRDVIARRGLALHAAGDRAGAERAREEGEEIEERIGLIQERWR